MVTGSTDGIGRAYASELAERGFKIMLISRTQSRLDEVKTEIESKFKVEVSERVEIANLFFVQKYLLFFYFSCSGIHVRLNRKIY